MIEPRLRNIESPVMREVSVSYYLCTRINPDSTDIVYAGNSDDNADWIFYDAFDKDTFFISNKANGGYVCATQDYRVITSKHVEPNYKREWVFNRIEGKSNEFFEICLAGEDGGDPTKVLTVDSGLGTLTAPLLTGRFADDDPNRARQIWIITPGITDKELGIEEQIAPIDVGRLRASNPTTILEAVRYAGSQDSIMTASYDGESRVRYDQTSVSSLLYLGGSPGFAILQTRARAPYRLGKPLSSRQTFVLSEHKHGLVQRVGYFDEENGVFLQRSDDATGNASVQLVLRNSASGRLVEEVVPQEKWSNDKLNGLGPSKIVADFDAIQTLVVDLDWLEGVAEVGFVFGDSIAYVHRFQCNNSSKGVLMSSPSLPLRWEISSDVDDHDSVLRAVAGCVAVDGKPDESARERTKVIEGDRLLVGYNSEFVAFRIRPDCLKFSGLSLTELGFDSLGGAKWRLTKNPYVFADGDWESFGPESVFQYCKSRRTETGSGSDVAEGRGLRKFDVGPSSVIGGSVEGDPDVLSVEIEVSEDGYYPLTVSWKEFL